MLKEFSKGINETILCAASNTSQEKIYYIQLHSHCNLSLGNCYRPTKVITLDIKDTKCNYKSNVMSLIFPL